MSPFRLSIAQVIHSLEPGGAEALLVDLARAAPTADLDLVVMSLMRIRDRRYLNQLDAVGVEVVQIGLSSRWDPSAITRAVSELRRRSPALLHTHLKHADVVGAVASRRLGIPLVSTLHVIEDRVTALGRVKRELAGRARAGVAARTIAVSEAQRQWYLDAFSVRPESVVTVRNGVHSPPPLSSAARAAFRSSLHLGDDDVFALNVGIMRPGKGHGDLLNALAHLPCDLPIHVSLAGDGPLRPALEAQARKAGLMPGRVSFLGLRDDVDDLLGAADFVVSASHLEALPTVLIEALAAGRPAVATDVGGVTEVVSPDEALLVPPHDAEALAAALRTAATDHELRARMGAAARRRFETEFDATIWAARLRRVYEEVLARCSTAL